MTTSSILLKGATILCHDESDRVRPLRNADILVQGNKITKVGTRISAPSGAEVVDCRSKIISPGFVDTHHHLWQTQLKGNHAESSIFDYLPTGYWQSYVYSPKDTFWGQLGGALEAIDAGTTFVLDHAHGCQTKEHVTEALAATCASGIRSIFAYAHPTYFDKWDTKTCQPSRDIIPQSSIQHLIELAQEQPYGNGRVHIGFGFDYWFLPKEAIVGTFEALRNAGIKLFTSHSAKNAVFGQQSNLHALVGFDLIKKPHDIVLSHATGLNAEERNILVETQIPVSSTPDTEAQMGFGWPTAFTPGINYSLGVDCHSSSPSSILTLARTALLMARQQAGVRNIEAGKVDLQLQGTSEEAFNAATIRGARAVQLGDKIGSIKEGKLADLVIFDTLSSTGMSCVSESDPLTAVVRHSDVRDIEGVIIDGIWRKRDGKLLPVQARTASETVDWTHVRDQLNQSRKRIQEKQKELNMELAKEALIAMYGMDKKNLLGRS